jgi:hypothetical protein
MQGEIGDLSELARAMLTADLGQLEQLIREAASQAGGGRIENFLHVGFFSRRALEQMNLDAAGQQLRDLAARLEEAGMSPEEVAALRALIDRLMEAPRKSVRNFTERELQQQNHDYMEKFRRETLLEKSFYHLTESRTSSRSAGGASSAASSTCTRPCGATCRTAASRSSWSSSSARRIGRN